MCFLSLCLVLLVAGSGCQEEGPPRYHVVGTVTYKGEPVPVGSIIFQPDATAGQSGPYGHASIRDGHFDTRNGGAPTTGGAQIVIIEAFDGNVVNPDYAPYGSSLGLGYRKKLPLPKSKDAKVDIELTERN